MSNRRSALYTLCLFEAFHPQGSVSLDSRVASLPYESSSLATSRGNEKIGGTGYCVTYDTDRQSRNADFISIARRAIRNPRPEGPSNLRTFRPIGPVNLKNPFSTTFFHNPFPQPFYTTRRRQAATTLGPKARQPSHRRCVPRGIFLV